MDEKEQTKWYINVLDLVDQMLNPCYSTQFSPGGIRENQLDAYDYHPNELWRVPIMEKRQVLELLNICTQKMFMRHDPHMFAKWAENYYTPVLHTLSRTSRYPRTQRQSQPRDEIAYKLNEDLNRILTEMRWIDDGTFNFDWDQGLAYLNFYFKKCQDLEQRQNYRLSSKNRQPYSPSYVTRGSMVLNTILLDCITPEFYDIVCSHSILLLETFISLINDHPRNARETYYKDFANKIQDELGHVHYETPPMDMLPEEQRIIVCMIEQAEIASQLMGLLFYPTYIAEAANRIPYLVDPRNDSVRNDQELAILLGANLQKKQYRRDFELLNEPDPVKRALNIKNIRERYF
ncbi:hypothetical protein EBU71_16690, partial [bacterium]|nr:hypothetical protein [Candidatus Elulimicrobium humile]